ncbi:MAG: sigma 54-interacting transcriptional regulator [Bacillota bacterium]|nr:sigma 54-interacting transcriptional regulator [Bacillota bacterium]
MTNDRHSMDSLFEIIDQTLDDFSGMLIVDKKGQVIYASPSFSEYLFDLDPVAVMGKDIEELSPGSGLLEVLNTGIPQLGKIWEIRGHKMVVSRYPIVKDRIIGAMSLIQFRRLEDSFDLVEQLTEHHEHLDYYKQELKQLWCAKYSFDSILGNSFAIMEAKRKAWDIAITHSPVLVTGETGTGKELFAQAIHQDSPQKDGPFVAVNCAGIPENLMESELFGYEEGAFTGARRGGKPGKFELSNSGTIFLDEISELPLYMQAKLLRVLQEHEVERVGGNGITPVNSRVISATNRDLEAMVREGSFREDLYYRLNVFHVRVPALRERVEDISTISHHFIAAFNREIGTRVSGMDERALHMMMKYRWPGNVRELKSTIERACLDTKMGFIKLSHLYYIKDQMENSDDRGSDTQLSLKTIRMEAERKAILNVLEKTGGNKTLACKLLAVNRTSFYSKLKELGIEDYI